MRLNPQAKLSLRDQVYALTNELRVWEQRPQFDPLVRDELLERISTFPHTAQREGLHIAGADGDGEFPLLTYGDAYIYIAVAQTAVYADHPLTGLHEAGPSVESLVTIAWLTEAERQRREALDKAFAALAGASVASVIARSDYRELKAAEAGRRAPPAELARTLIRPQASDTGNLSIQLQTTAQLGAALRLIEADEPPAYVLIEGTMSLPLVAQETSSLFYEHLRRLCCVAARARGVAFLTVSQSHGLPGVDLVEELAREVAGGEGSTPGEHWYLRLPLPGVDSWEFTPATGRVPPPGAVSYLVRFHRSTPTLRIDIDSGFWTERVRGRDEAATRANERRIFSDLDYACHDQRAYGYPYPLYAAQERTRLSRSDRETLRRQVIEAGVRGGLRRATFRTAPRDVSGR